MIFGLGKKKKRRSLDGIANFSGFISKDSLLEGTLGGSGDYKVAGKVVGNCDLSGTLFIEPGGEWLGHIVADVVIIAGKVEGDVTARAKLDLTKTARIKGCLECPMLSMEYGAVHDGEIHVKGGGKISHYTERRDRPDAANDPSIDPAND